VREGGTKISAPRRRRQQPGARSRELGGKRRRLSFISSPPSLPICYWSLVWIRFHHSSVHSYVSNNSYRHGLSAISIILKSILS